MGLHNLNLKREKDSKSQKEAEAKNEAGPRVAGTLRSRASSVLTRLSFCVTNRASVVLVAADVIGVAVASAVLVTAVTSSQAGVQVGSALGNLINSATAGSGSGSGSWSDRSCLIDADDSSHGSMDFADIEKFGNSRRDSNRQGTVRGQLGRRVTRESVRVEAGVVGSVYRERMVSRSDDNEGDHITDIIGSYGRVVGDTVGVPVVCRCVGLRYRY